MSAPASPPDRPAAKPRVLFVDDEQAVLDGFARTLRSRFEVRTAPGGQEGLDMLVEDGPFTVIVSDMRMPGMDGAKVLGRAAVLTPSTIRVLLTGFADVNAAAEAVNAGGIFRFLFKPCAPPDLAAALDAAVAQHRLVEAEKELLEQTLRGSVKALLETLSLANPGIFARATRISRIVREALPRLDVPDRWVVEVAADLSQMGAVILPPHVVLKLDRGLPLDPHEHDMVSTIPRLSHQLISSIPRLGPVRDVILGHTGIGTGAGRAAALLRAAAEIDLLEARGLTRQEAVGVLRQRTCFVPAEVLDALEPPAGSEPTVVETDLWHLETGMVLAQDVTDINGILLVGRGHEITPHLLARLRHFQVRVSDPLYVKGRA